MEQIQPEQIIDQIIDPATGQPTTFNEALRGRYERISLLTLDLAEDAGTDAQNYRHWPEPRNGEKTPRAATRFARGIAAMSKSVWAHKIIEQLRLRLMGKIHNEAARRAASAPREPVPMAVPVRHSEIPASPNAIGAVRGPSIMTGIGEPTPSSIDDEEDTEQEILDDWLAEMSELQPALAEKFAKLVNSGKSLVASTENLETLEQITDWLNQEIDHLQTDDAEKDVNTRPP